MLTGIPELDKVRRKYPQYNSMDDSTLASKLAVKFPNAYGYLPDKVKANTHTDPVVKTVSDNMHTSLLDHIGSAIKQTISDYGTALSQPGQKLNEAIGEFSKGSVGKGIANLAESGVALFGTLLAPLSVPAEKIGSVLPQSIQNMGLSKKVADTINYNINAPTATPQGLVDKLVDTLPDHIPIPTGNGNLTYVTKDEFKNLGLPKDVADKLSEAGQNVNNLLVQTLLGKKAEMMLPEQFKPLYDTNYKGNTSTEAQGSTTTEKPIQTTTQQENVQPTLSKSTYYMPLSDLSPEAVQTRLLTERQKFTDMQLSDEVHQHWNEPQDMGNLSEQNTVSDKIASAVGNVLGKSQAKAMFADESMKKLNSYYNFFKDEFTRKGVKQLLPQLRDAVENTAYIAGEQTGKDFKVMFKDANDRKSLFWIRTSSALNDGIPSLDALKSELGKVKGTEYESQVQHAITNYDRLVPGVANVAAATDGMYARANSFGIDYQYRKGYISDLVKDANAVDNPFPMRGKDGSRYYLHDREYETAGDAVKAGKKLISTDIAEVLQNRKRNGELQIQQKIFTDKMKTMIDPSTKLPLTKKSTVKLSPVDLQNKGVDELRNIFKDNVNTENMSDADIFKEANKVSAARDIYNALRKNKGEVNTEIQNNIDNLRNDGYKVEVKPNRKGQQRLFVNDIEQNSKELYIKRTIQSPKDYVPVRMFNRQTINVHPDYARLMKAMMGDDSVKNSLIGDITLQAEGTLKHSILGLDTFHLSRMAQLGLAILGHDNYNRGLSLIEYSPEILSQLRDAGQVSPDLYNFYMQSKPTFDKLVSGGLNLGKYMENMERGLIGKSGLSGFNTFVFQKFGRGIMSELAMKMYDRNAKMFGDKLSDEQIISKTVKEANIYYANLGRQGIFKNPTWQSLSRIFALAPNWWESGIKRELLGFKQIAQIPTDIVKGNGVRVGNVARGLGSLTLGWIAANQIANMITRGHPTWNNPEDGHKWDAWIPGGTRGEGYWLSPISTSFELTHDMLRYMEMGNDVMQSALRIGRNKLSPVGRALDVIAEQRNYQGKKLVGKDIFLEAGKALDPTMLTLRGISPLYPQSDLERQLFASGGVKLSPIYSIGKTKAEQEMMKIINNKGEFYTTPEEQAKYNFIYKYVDKMKKGEVTQSDKDEAKKLNIFTAPNIKKMQRLLSETAARLAFKKLTAEEATKVWKLMKPQERSQYIDIYQTKLDNALQSGQNMRKVLGQQ